MGHMAGRMGTVRAKGRKLELSCAFGARVTFLLRDHVRACLANPSTGSEENGARAADHPGLRNWKTPRKAKPGQQAGLPHAGAGGQQIFAASSPDVD